jgi:hypothetical protein
MGHPANAKKKLNAEAAEGSGGGNAELRIGVEQGGIVRKRT